MSRHTPMACRFVGSPAGFADGLNTTRLVASGTALVAGILVLVLVRQHAAAPVAAQPHQFSLD